MQKSRRDSFYSDDRTLVRIILETDLQEIKMDLSYSVAKCYGKKFGKKNCTNCRYKYACSALIGLSNIVQDKRIDYRGTPKAF
jgi:MoaA/NifB/PqqE/SkfB family radical SAM enzyme